MSLPPTTLAVTQQRYGGPEVLSLTEVRTPTPQPGEVLLRVRASSINARDWHIMRGEPRLARFADRDTFGRRGPRIACRGTDVGGIVLAVGAGVRRWHPGDRVFGEGTGTFAEHAVARADQLATLPPDVTFTQAAAVPLAGTTAQLCIEAAAPAPGSSILINGASGGVGTFALQLAKARELEITAVVSPRNRALAGALGADHVLDYTAEDFTRTGRTHDVVLDLVGNRSLRDLRRVAGPAGSLVLSGGGVPGHGRLLGPMRLLVWSQISGRLTRTPILIPRARPTADTLRSLAGQLTAQRLAPIIEQTFPLAHTADAIAQMETRHTTAKIAITVD